MQRTAQAPVDGHGVSGDVASSFLAWWERSAQRIAELSERAEDLDRLIQIVSCVAANVEPDGNPLLGAIFENVEGDHGVVESMETDPVSGARTCQIRYPNGVVEHLAVLIAVDGLIPPKVAEACSRFLSLPSLSPGHGPREATSSGELVDEVGAADAQLRQLGWSDEEIARLGFRARSLGGPAATLGPDVVA